MAMTFVVIVEMKTLVVVIVMVVDDEIMMNEIVEIWTVEMVRN